MILRRTRSLAAVLVCLCCFRAAGADSPSPAKARVLLLTGIDYPGHLWRETAPILTAALRKDPRLEVCTVEDPNFLDSAAVQKYEVILLHFQNWEKPGPDAKARENLREFVASGKGLVLVHFACGAWHDEWPEFEKIAGRIWFGAKPGPGKRQHDPYGVFRVEVAKPDHPITLGFPAFETQDELYTCLTGDYPITVLCQSRSKADGREYPIAFVSEYGKGRTFHCLLGHNAKSLSSEPVQELYRRGSCWAAGMSPVSAPLSK